MDAFLSPGLSRKRPRVNLEFPLSTTVLAKVQKTIRNQPFFVAYEHYFEDLIAFGS